MKLLRIVEISVFTFVVFCYSNNVFAADKKNETVPPKEWTVWLDNLKREMISKGISQKTIDKAYKNKKFL